MSISLATLFHPMTKLLAAATDQDGDPLIITAVSAVSTNGAVTLGGGNITYTPPGHYAGDDKISCTLTDCRGAGSTGHVLITVASPPFFTSGSMASDHSSFTLTGMGAASQPFVLQPATNLMPQVT